MTETETPPHFIRHDDSQIELVNPDNVRTTMASIEFLQQVTDDHNRMTTALQTVQKLHVLMESSRRCAACNPMEWPCPTRQAADEALA